MTDTPTSGTAHNKVRASTPLPTTEQPAAQRETVADLSREGLLAEAVRTHLRWVANQRQLIADQRAGSLNPHGPQSEDPFEAAEAEYKIILAELTGEAE